MAKLPPKPMNIVHEYFPIGSESPMNKGAFDVYKEQEEEKTLLNKNDDTMLYKTSTTDYYKDNPIVDDPDKPGEKIRKKKLEARQKSQRVEVGEGAGNELNEVVLTGKKL